MKLVRLSNVLSLLAVVVTTGCGDGSTDPSRDSTVRIGAAVSLTGSLAVEGTDVRRGYELWAGWVNEEYGGIRVDGRRRKVELILHDDGSDAARAAEITERLVTEDSVHFLLGPYGSAATLTATVVAEALGVPMVAGSGAAEEIFTRGFTNTFVVLTPGREYTKAAMQSLAALGAKTVVLVHEQGGAFSMSVADGAAHWADEYGLQVLAVLSYPRLATDVAPLIDQARALDPDAFIGGGHFNDAVLLARTAAQRGFRPPAMMLTVGPGVPEFVTALRDTAELILGPTQWESTMTWQGIYLGTPAEYALRYGLRFNAAPSYQAAQSTASGLVLMHAIEAAGTLDRAAVRTALRATNLMTFYGPVRFDATGKNIAKPMGVVQVQDGRTVVVAPAEVKVAEWVYHR